MAVAGITSAARAQATSWTFTGPIASWETLSNWTAGIPTLDTTAVFDAAAPTYTVQISESGYAKSIRVSHGDVFLRQADTALTVAGLTATAASAGLIIDGGQLHTQSLDVADAGTFGFTSGVITVDGGAFRPHLHEVLFDTRFGGNENGPTALQNSFAISADGTATSNLRLTNSATLTSDAWGMFVGLNTGRGMVEVTGLGSSLSLPDADIYVGIAHDPPSGVPAQGTLLVSNGGQISGKSFLVGNNSGSALVSVDGANSVLHYSSSFAVGGFTNDLNHRSVGTLNVSNGGQVHGDTFGWIGSYGSRGYAQVNGTNSRITTSGFIVGGFANGFGDQFIPSDGTLSLTEGGQIISDRTMYIGYPGSSGYVNVDGLDSKFDCTEQGIFIGHDVAYHQEVAYPGLGSLVVTNGGEASGRGVTIGSIGAHGNVRVEGLGAKLAATFFDLTIGSNGRAFDATYFPSNGTLMATSGAQVSAAMEIEIGYAGGIGLAVVEDASLGAGTELRVGYGQRTAVGVVYPSTGTLIALGGAGVTSSRAVIGARSGSGTASLNGVGTTWANSTDFHIGNDGSGSISFNGGGTMSISDHAAINNGGLLKVWSGGRINLSGGTLSTQSLDAEGVSSRLNWTGGALRLNGGAANIGAVTVPSGGILAGTGTFNSSITVASNGTISPGNNAGILRATSLSASAQTVFDIELGDASPGSGYDQLQLTGAASLNGTMRVSLLPEFQPGHSFDVVTFSSATGDVTLDYSSQYPGLILDKSLSATALTLTASSLYAGDANLDARVDLRDLQALSSHFNSTAPGWMSGDFTGDGFVDASDLTILADNWQAGIGVTVGMSLDGALGLLDSMTTAPEPSVLGMLGFGITGVLSSRKRARRS